MMTFCTVTTDASSGPGSLAACFEAAEDPYNDVITFSSSLTDATINVSGLEILETQGNMFLRGGDRNITLNAENDNAHFIVVDSDTPNRTSLRIENLNLVNGSWASIYAADAELKLSGVTIESTSSGRAVQVQDFYNWNADPQVDIRHSAFRNNAAGALFIGHTGTHGHFAGTTSGSINVASSEFSGNTVSGLVDGGAIEIRHHHLEGFHPLEINIDNNTISDNAARNGGGLHIIGNNLTTRLLNNTIVENTASNAYGGAFISAVGTTTINNTIIYDNASATGANDLHMNGTASGTNNIMNGTTGFGGSYTATDPMLAPLADNGGLSRTHALTAASTAAKDAGNNAAWTSVHSDGPIRKLGDQRGPMYSRIAGSTTGTDTIDIGAYECNNSIRGRAVIDSDRFPLGNGVGNVEITATNAPETPHTAKTTNASGMPVVDIDINGDGVIDAQTERGWYWMDDLTDDIWNTAVTDTPGESVILGPVSHNLLPTKTGELTNYRVTGISGFTLLTTATVAAGADEFASFAGSGGGVIGFDEITGQFVGDEYLQSHGVSFDFGVTPPEQWGVFHEGNPQTIGNLDGYDGRYR
ncbi:MAG: choice-of-anchor Q domain-containing protein, partial [Planctomycetota bacterium]